MRAWIRTAIRRECGRCAGPAPTDETLTADVAPPADRSAMLARIRALLDAHTPDWKLTQSGDDRDR